jgi:hypothetical protein
MVRSYLLHLGVGPVGYALGLIALLPGWRTHRWPRLLALAIAVACTGAAFGPGIPVGEHVLWSPYRLLMGWVPGFATVRIPARFVVMAHLGFALLAALGVERLLARAGRLAWPGALAIGAVAIAALGPRPPLRLVPEPVGDDVAPAYRWLAEHGEGRPLLELPEAILAAAGRRMYLSTFHWLPIVDGYSAYNPKTSSFIHSLASGLPKEEALQELVDWVDIGWILVHRDGIPRWARRAWYGLPPPGLVPAGVWGDDLLFRVTQPVRNDRRERLLSTRETLGGVPLAPLGDRCPGALRVVARPPAPWPPFSRQDLEVEVRNDGPAPWPAFGLLPAYLVRLRIDLPGAPPPWWFRRSLDLPGDVPAGGRIRVPVSLWMPPKPGRYAFELSLEQVHVGPLVRCGVEALRLPVTVQGEPVAPESPLGTGAAAQVP